MADRLKNQFFVFHANSGFTVIRNILKVCSLLEHPVFRLLFQTPGCRKPDALTYYNVSCTKMHFSAYILCKLRKLKLKTDGNNIIRKPNQNVTKLKSKFPLILIQLWTARAWSLGFSNFLQTILSPFYFQKYRTLFIVVLTKRAILVLPNFNICWHLFLQRFWVNVSLALWN